MHVTAQSTDLKSGTFDILVATDIAARGIDVSKVSHVINYDVPDTQKPTPTESDGLDAPSVPVRRVPSLPAMVALPFARLSAHRPNHSRARD